MSFVTTLFEIKLCKSHEERNLITFVIWLIYRSKIIFNIQVLENVEGNNNIAQTSNEYCLNVEYFY